MDDLISRKALLGTERLLMTYIVRNNPTAKYILEQVLYDIEHAETAFDKEKVIEELENLKAQYFITIVNAGDERLGFAYKYVWNALNHAIEIVEKGGIE